MTLQQIKQMQAARKLKVEEESLSFKWGNTGRRLAPMSSLNQEEQDTTDWKQELRDFINDKSKKYDMPRDKYGYVNLMAQLAANNEIDRKRLAALIARTNEEIRTREDQDREDLVQEAREEAKAQLNAKLARELTLARIDALFHWEDCFLTGVVDDEHRVFIAQVLAREAKALQDQDQAQEDWDQDREDLVQEAHYFTYYTGVHQR